MSDNEIEVLDLRIFLGLFLLEGDKKNRYIKDIEDVDIKNLGNILYGLADVVARKKNLNAEEKRKFISSMGVSMSLSENFYNPPETTLLKKRKITRCLRCHKVKTLQDTTSNQSDV